MKKIFIATAIMAASYVGNAQTTFGIEASGILSRIKSTYDGNESTSPENRISWKAGGVANVPLTEHVSFRPEVNVLRKGGLLRANKSYNIGGQVYDYNIRQTYQLTYAEVPLNIVYNSKGTTGGMAGNFFIGAGPSVSYGFGGKIKSETKQTTGGQESNNATTTNVVFDNKKNVNDGKAHFKPLEVGASVTAGYHITDVLLVQLLYNHGFTNIYPDKTQKLRNSYFSVGIGVVF